METPKDIDPSAVSILVDQSISKPIGTGFYFVERRYFVTARHVVVDEKSGSVRSNLVLMQNAPNYPTAKVVFLHPSLDVAVLEISQGCCELPLYPSDQRLTGRSGLRYWGYCPSKSDKRTHQYMVAVVDIPEYECEPPRERSDGTEWVLKFNSDLSEGGHSGGPVLGAGGGVVAIITQGHTGWVRATEIRSLLPYITLRFA